MHRPYPGGFHAFKPRAEDTKKDQDLATITFNGTPWNSQTCTWTLPTPHSGVMEFTGTANMQSTSGGSGLISSQNITPLDAVKSTLSKRKYDLNCPIPKKQHISDERMAAHFKSLSISLQDSDSDDDHCAFPSTSSSFKDRKKTNRPITTEELQESIKNGKKLIVSQELLKFNKSTDKLLPHLLKMEKHCTALIPWKPFLSIEELICKNDEQQHLPPTADNEEDLGILVDYEEDNNNLDIINLNGNNNNHLDRNQNDFDMDMD
ncbi:hypothetical protein ACFFRR_000951 [Megaselia abdita]